VGPLLIFSISLVYLRIQGLKIRESKAIDSDPLTWVFLYEHGPGSGSRSVSGFGIGSQSESVVLDSVLNAAIIKR
jgi:hypothetical protein